MKKVFFDELDYKVLKELVKDARVSSGVIAQRLGANERTVSRRIKKLIDKKAIRVTAIVDPSVFDYHSIADIYLRVEEEIFDDFVQSCKKNSNICYIAFGWGESNLGIQARFLDNDQLLEFINETLEKTQGVKVMNYFIIPKILYNIDSWTPVRSDFKK